jgi:hypothetical protein
MPVTVACPQCGILLRMPNTSHGRFARCPKCGATVERPPDAEEIQEVIPVDEPAEEPAPAPRRRRPVREYDDGDDDEPRRRSRRPRFQCPFCGTRGFPVVERRTSTAGWDRRTWLFPRKLRSTRVAIVTHGPAGYQDAASGQAGAYAVRVMTTLLSPKVPGPT